MMILTILFVTVTLTAAARINPRCNTKADLYIVLTASDTMINQRNYLNGAREGLRDWFDRTQQNRGTGPQVSLCAYGDGATEQILYGSTLDVTKIRMEGGISRLDLGIECARNSSRRNGRPGVPQYLIIITVEDPLGLELDQYFNEVRQQIAAARTINNFVRVTVTGVTDSHNPAFYSPLPDAGFYVNIQPTFSEFANLINDGGFTDSDLWRQFCPDAIATTAPPTTAPPTTPRPTPPRVQGLCNDCIIIEGVGYNAYPGDCRKYVQCTLTDGSHSPWDGPYEIRWTALGTFWWQTQVEQHHARAVDCQYDPCRNNFGLTAWADERNCAGRWICRGRQTVAWECCPGGFRWDDRLKECVLNLPGSAFCDILCPPLELVPPDCPMATMADRRFYYDIRSASSAPRGCRLGMFFDVKACTCVGIPVPACDPIFHLKFDDGQIKDHSRNRFYIANINVQAAYDNRNGRWYGVFDKALTTQLLVSGLANLDMMYNFAIVADYDSQNNVNARAALVGTTNCRKQRGPYSLALNPNYGQVEGYVLTQVGVTDSEVTASASSLRTGLNHAVYRYHSGPGLSVKDNGGQQTNTVTAGRVWHRDATCGVHIGWSEDLDYFTGRIYEVLIYRDPDCIPAVL